MSERPIDPYADEIPLRRAARDAEDYPQNRFFTPFGVVITLAALLMIAVVTWGIYDRSQSQPRSGRAADFTAPLLGEEGEFTLSDYRGSVVVINFWGSWCGPCRLEAPMLQRTYEAYQDQGVVFVGVDVKDPEAKALAYIEEFSITYINVVDIGGRIEDAYHTQGVPETFVVDKNGEIVEFFFAQPREADLRAAIEEALNS